MEIKITPIGPDRSELTEIFCHEESEEVRGIVHFIRSQEQQLTGFRDGRQYQIPVSDVYYIEAVDNRCFLYSREQVYECRQRLYELEALLKERHFLRISKSMIVSLMAVRSVRPGLGGRMTAVLRNDEQVIISRKYVPALKEALKGDTL